MGMYMPDPPDPKETAQVQAGLNKDAAITQSLLGMTNQTTPFWSLKYNKVGNWNDTPNAAPGAAPAVAPPAPPPSAPETKTLWEDGDRTRRITGTTAPTGGSSQNSSGYQQSDGLYDVPRFEAVQTLSPELQGIVDNFLGTAGSLSSRLNDTMGKPIDLSGLPGRVNNVSLRDVGTSLGYNGPGQQFTFGGDNPIQMSVGPNDYSANRKEVEDALMSRLNPQLDRDRARSEADLRARGIAPGSGRAYDGAMDELNRQSNDARMSAILAGGQEQTRLANLDLAQGQFANSAQQQAYQQALERAGFSNAAQQVAFGQNLTGKQFEREGIGMNNQNALAMANFQNAARAAGLEELFAVRNQTPNEIAALLSGTQLVGPKFTQTPQPGVNGVDYTKLVNDQYNAQAQASGGMMDGLFGLGKTLLGGLKLSDRRAKSDITAVGRLDNGLTVYSYRYNGGDHTEIGLMADEVKEIHPQAVSEHPSGFEMVNYAEAVR